MEQQLLFSASIIGGIRSSQRPLLYPLTMALLAKIIRHRKLLWLFLVYSDDFLPPLRDTKVYQSWLKLYHFACFITLGNIHNDIIGGIENYPTGQEM